ncbi:MAG: peptidylprolyl isomerase [Elusimicrobia bacterium]|nr:peptidylprolyl isomerase [Elusimicrobiota bacterium]
MTLISINGKEVDGAALLDFLQAQRRADVVHDFLVFNLMMKSAEEYKIQVTDAELQKAADEFRKSRDLVTAKETRDWMAASRLSDQEFDALVETEVKVNKLKEKVVAERVGKYWAEHGVEYDSVKISQIVVQSRSLAQELKAKLEDGETAFYRLARDHSGDTSSKDAGGYLGILRRSDLTAELQGQVFAGKKGDILGPLELGKQFILIEIHEVRKAKLEDVRPDVEEAIWQAWLEEKLS